MKVRELMTILAMMPQELDVIVSSQGETMQVPLEAKVEATCNVDEGDEGEEIVRLYTDNGEDR